MNFFRRFLPWLQMPADRKVSAAWLADRRREEFTEGHTGISWRWPIRRDIDDNGPRNRWILRN